VCCSRSFTTEDQLIRLPLTVELDEEVGAFRFLDTFTSRLHLLDLTGTCN